MNALPFGLALLLAFCGTGCAGPDAVPRIDPQYGALVDAAEARYAAGQIEKAAHSYARALQRARAMDDAAAIGDCAYNLAACVLSAGDLDKARNYLLEARRAMERSGRPALDVLFLEAQVARLQNRTGDAAALCDRILILAADDGDPTWPFQVYLFEARLACDAGEKRTARQKLDVASDLLEEIDDPHLRARAALVTGEVLLLEGSHGEAARSFEAQATNLREAGRYHDMACGLLRAGGAFLDADEPVRAADCLFRAARSLFALDDATARDTAETARAASLLANDADLTQRIDSLLSEMNAAREENQ